MNGRVLAMCVTRLCWTRVEDQILTLESRCAAAEGRQEIYQECTTFLNKSRVAVRYVVVVVLTFDSSGANPFCVGVSGLGDWARPESGIQILDFGPSKSLLHLQMRWRPDDPRSPSIEYGPINKDGTFPSEKFVAGAVPSFDWL